MVLKMQSDYFANKINEMIFVMETRSVFFKVGT
jgi:hypothetical protein